MTDQDLLYASEEDIEFFNRVTDELPKSGIGNDSNGQPMPHACGAHSVRCFRRIVEIVKPKDIFEIGFNVGGSAALWMELSGGKLISCDISTRLETIQAAEIIHDRYKDRFYFFLSDSAEIINHKGIMGWLPNIKFDLIFIDGGHEEHHVLADIKLALALGIKYLAFDDWLPQYGPGVQSAIAQFSQLEKVEVMGNICLMRNTSV